MKKNNDKLLKKTKRVSHENRSEIRKFVKK